MIAPFRNSKFFLIVLASLASFVVGCSSNTTTAPPNGVAAAGTLKGLIVDSTSKLPISGALVTLSSQSSQNKSILTNSIGEFELDSLSAGMWQILVSKGGYNPRVDSIRIVDASLTEYDHGLLAVATKIVGWAQVPSGVFQQLLCVCHATNSIFYAAGFAGTVIKSTDGGSTWTQVAQPYNDNIYCIHFVDANRGVVLGNAGGAFTTTNGGSSWTKVGVPNYAYRASSFVDGATPGLFGVASGGNGTSGALIQTTDGGFTWSDQSSNVPAAGTLYAVAMSSRTNGFTADYTSDVYQTSNGSSWNLVSNTGVGGTWFIAAAAPDAENATLVGRDGTVLHTSSAGAQWSSQSFSVQLNGVSFFDTMHGITVGSNGKILLTTDAAVTWKDMTTSGSSLNQVAFSDPFHAIIVGDNGTILQSIAQ